VTGRVVLVGGGPGAPDLITVRGLERLRAADVVVVDRLAPTSLLDGLSAEVVDASRGPDSRTLTHGQIVTLMIDRARAGATVVRLKGGDPYVLAHGPQEVAACVAAGVEVEVVPGVSSALAAPALAGVPLTEVEGAAGFTVVSGHVDPADPANRVDWSALAGARTTLVILMGMRRLAAIARRLLEDGLPPDTPAACVADASLPTQATVRTTLANLPHGVEAAGLTNPAVVVISPRFTAASRGSGRRDDARARRVLVLGGSRSGKSAFAESLLAHEPAVVYLATAATRPDDPEWAERLQRHRDRRPAHWQTVETADVGSMLSADGPPVLLDSATTWLARAMDDAGSWDDPQVDIEPLISELVDSWQESRRAVIAVSDEVGSGVVPATAAGRQFRDALGLLNQRLAAQADEVHLVVAGIARRLR